MARNATNKLLQQAKRLKSDEFYTQLCDIESELRHYKPHFKNKTVFCNCDDPRLSNFFRYFAINFEELQLKAVLTSCYKEQPNSIFAEESSESGFFFEYTNSEIEKSQLNSPIVTPFNGSGDFRSNESIELLKRSDIVVTNPPFSLFREYVEQLVKHNKKFLIILLH